MEKQDPMKHYCHHKLALSPHMREVAGSIPGPGPACLS